MNKNVENRQTASGVKVLKKLVTWKKFYTERLKGTKRPKKVGVGFGNFNIFSTLYPLKTVLN